MKWNWGTGIFISFIIFALSIAFIVLFPFNQKVDLVTEDYYEKELKYQEQIDRIERTRKLNEEISIIHEQDLLKISFPVLYSNVKGELFFYRPSDAGKDLTKEIRLDKLNRQDINIGDLMPGLWKVRVLWSMSGESYYYEKTIMI